MQKIAQKQPLALSLITAAVLMTGYAGQAIAATVPTSTTLADKQEIFIQTTAEPATLDPQKMEGTGESLIARQLFEGLVNTDENDAIIPGVAERWEANSDFTQWKIYLRHNAKWSNGDPVTAHDFVYAWQRLVDPRTASPYASYLSFMNMRNVQEIVAGKKPVSELGVRALDDFTLELDLTAPVPYAIDLTQHASLYPVHKATLDKHGDNWLRPENLVGNGAYKLTARIVNEKLSFERNPLYWNDKESVIERAHLVIATESAGIAQYRSGQLDMALIPQALYKDAKFRQEYDSQIHSFPKLCTFTYAMNQANAPLSDIRVRKALDLAIDRDVITQKVLGFGQKSTFTFTPNYIGAGEKIAQPEYAAWTQAERNAEAKKLLAEAGYSKANPLKTDVLYNTNEGLKTIAVAATSMWKQNLDGAAEVKMRNMEWKTFLEAKQQRDFNLAFHAWCADYNEASTFLTYYLSNNEQNNTGFHSARFDQLIKDSYLAKTEAERAEIYAAAEAELDKHHPFVAIYHYAGLFIKNPKLHGYDGKSPQSIYFFKDLYWG